MKHTNDTALTRFTLLEAEGRYFDGKTAKPHEVIVKFGRTTLAILHVDGTPLDHWALGALTALAGPVDRLALTPDPDGQERLLLADPTMIEAIREVCPDLDRRPKSYRRKELGILLKWGAGGLAAVAVILLVIFPMLADRLAPMVPKRTSLAIGQQTEKILATALSNGNTPEYCVAPEGISALAIMQKRLDDAAKALDGQNEDLDIGVLQSEIPNAFALPGDRIILTSGLIEQAETPEEVTAILAHEIAHHEHHDMMRTLIRRSGSAAFIGLFFGDVTGGFAIAITADTLLNASYSRDAEQAADERAYALLAEAGLPSTPMASFFERLGHAHKDEKTEERKLSDTELEIEAGEGASEDTMLDWLHDAGSYFASHPAPKERALEARAADIIGDKQFTPSLDDTNWLALRQICTQTALH